MSKIISKTIKALILNHKNETFMTENAFDIINMKKTELIKLKKLCLNFRFKIKDNEIILLLKHNKFKNK